MISRFALLSNFLLASAVLALPSSQLGNRLTRSDENPMSQLEPLGSVEWHADISTPSSWAGAVVAENNGAFNSVTATFTFPNTSGVAGSGLSIWIGIGNYACSDVFLAGIDVKITDRGVSYNAWFRSNTSSPINDFPGFVIHPDNVITLSIITTSALSAIARIDNRSAGQNIRHELDVGSSAADPLSCWNNAEWKVGRFENGNKNNLPLANFGSVTFTDATAASSSGIDYNPLNATIYRILDSTREPRTSVTPSNDSLVVTYLY